MSHDVDALEYYEARAREKAISADIVACELLKKHHAYRMDRAEEQLAMLEARYREVLEFSSLYARTLLPDVLLAGRAMALEHGNRLSAEDILKQVALKHNVRVADIKSKCKTNHIIPARFEACYELRRRTPLSFPQIGKLVGGRDHTTVLHGVRQHAKRNNLPRLDRA